MTEQAAGEFADVSLLDKLYRRRHFYNDYDRTTFTQERQDEVPEEIMSQIEPLIGDGNGHITVSGALGSSHEFHKAEAFVSVSITCNNDLEDIRKVHDIMRPHIQAMILEDHNEMSLLRDQILPPEKRKHEDPFNEKGPAIAAQSMVGAPKIAAPPPRSASVTVKTGGLKPKFGR